MKKHTLLLLSLLIILLTSLSGCAIEGRGRHIDIISPNAAIRLAMAELGGVGDASSAAAELQKKGDIDYYNVSIPTEQGTTLVYIDALSGAVIGGSDSNRHTGEVVTDKNSSLLLTPEDTGLQSPKGDGVQKYISSEEAIQIVLSKVPGASRDDIQDFEIEEEDGVAEYSGSIRYNGLEYEFEIDAYSGAIREWEVEDD